MYQTPPPTPPQAKKPRKHRPNRGRVRFSLELAVAVVLVIVVAVGLLAAGGSGRYIEPVIVPAGFGVAVAGGWPTSGHAALGAAAAYLMLETLAGRLEASRVAEQM